MFLNETLISPPLNSHFDKTNPQYDIYVNAPSAAMIKIPPIGFDSAAPAP